MKKRPKKWYCPKFKLSKTIRLVLPDKSGSLQFSCTKAQDIVTVFFDVKLKATQYSSEGYLYIKELFENAVHIQNNSFLVLEKM
ncbi:hypothetical protein DX873_14485 [Flagellimonas nanhaiensis]|uniref:Uncharacterized protein n=1 Tax=Flagellimonas nanhaiensis TaxID=2292706 RepID=A0A371JNQ0_9FLAO|nr:hypothetical protein DX873_14485 [Allomuricauda nanhaiensis]